MNELWGGGFPTLVRDYYSLRLHHYYYVTFLTLLVPPRPLLSAVFWDYLNSSTPTLSYDPAPATHHTTSPHTTLESYVHLDISWLLIYVHHLNIYSHPSNDPHPCPEILVTPSATSLLVCSLVPTQPPPLSTTGISPCSPLVACLYSLDCTVQPLIHMPLIACPLLYYLYPPPPILHSLYPYLVCSMISVPVVDPPPPPFACASTLPEIFPHKSPTLRCLSLLHAWCTAY